MFEKVIGRHLDLLSLLLYIGARLMGIVALKVSNYLNPNDLYVYRMERGPSPKEISTSPSNMGFIDIRPTSKLMFYLKHGLRPV